MLKIRFIPDNTSYDFVGRRWIAYTVTGLLFVISAISLVMQGLNLGIDFQGGILFEVHTPPTVDIGQVRSTLGGLHIGEVQVQQVGAEKELMIRVHRPDDSEGTQQAVVNKIKAALGEGYEYRRVELVGPKVGSELLRDGIIASALAIICIAAYVAFRFEWQFGVAAVVATFHDVAVTVGLFSVLQLDFDLTAVAALLTLAGYSINDTIVVFDRVRETLRKNKTADLAAVINLSINQTLSRTVLTVSTVALAVLALLFFGGGTLRNFSVAMTWGIVVGTYSSIFVAAALLMHMPPISSALSGAPVPAPGPQE
ncbi:MAG: protein translocase subunit SecF [Alphaproteobacteria bacterium]